MKKYKIIFLFGEKGFSLQCGEKLSKMISGILPHIPEDEITADMIEKATFSSVLNMRFSKYVGMIATELSDTPLRLPTGYSKFSFDTEIICYEHDIIEAITKFVMFCLKNIGVRDSEQKASWEEVAEKFSNMRMNALCGF